MKLRDYQTAGVQEIRHKFNHKIKRVLYQLSTGGGKTVIFSYIAKAASQKGSRTLIISHRIELLMQAGGTLEDLNLNPFYITQETKIPSPANLYVAMVKTLKNRLQKPEWMEWFLTINLLIIDEAHRSEFYYLNIFQGFKLGVTASPKRTGKMPQLANEYDTMVLGPDTQELINMGFLVRDKYFGVKVDISGVGYDNEGEYVNSQLFERYNKPELYRGLVENWKTICPGTKTIIFCVNIQHCIETARMFNAAGITAKFITSPVSRPQMGTGKAAETIYRRKMAEFENYLDGYALHSGDRDTLIKAHKNREFPVLINAGIFIEGYDDKSLETVVINLATTSLNKWLQMLGRGSRPYAGKDFFYILDFGLNADRLGHYRQQREWNLHHTESKGGGIPASKNCPRCDALIFASAMVCKYCGFEYPKTQEQKVAELVEFEYAAVSPQKLSFKEMSFAVIEEYAKQRGYKKPWIFRTIYTNKGEQALREYAQKKGYHHTWVFNQIRIFANTKKK